MLRRTYVTENAWDVWPCDDGRHGDVVLGSGYRTTRTVEGSHARTRGAKGFRTRRRPIEHRLASASAYAGRREQSESARGHSGARGIKHCAVPGRAGDPR